MTHSLFTNPDSRSSRLPLLLLSMTLGAVGARAQSTTRPQPVQAPLRSAGILHLATGSWTRAATGSAFGPDVLYNNEAAPLYFTSMREPLAITDEGRLPGTHSEGSADAYQIDAIRMAYCSGQTALLTATLEWYEGYAPCSDPSSNPSLVRTLVASGLPSTPIAGVQSCWLLTIDLTGSTLAFPLGADGADGNFDNDSSLDSFGWTLAFSGQGADPFTGSILAGDPNSASFGSGTKSGWGFPTGVGTGLGQEDHFWVEDVVVPSGCYDLGGYPASPWAGLYCRLFGTDVSDDLSTHYPCAATLNSTGSPAHLSVTGSASVADANFVLGAEPVPNQPGIFYYGTTQISVPFGNGVRCVGGSVQRLGISFASGNRLTRQASAELILYGAVGLTRHFQAWFRDPQGGGLSFNFSDASTITILP